MIILYFLIYVLSAFFAGLICYGIIDYSDKEIGIFYRILFLIIALTPIINTIFIIWYAIFFYVSTRN